jgi:hypothetical protein
MGVYTTNPIDHAREFQRNQRLEKFVGVVDVIRVPLAQVATQFATVADAGRLELCASKGGRRIDVVTVSARACRDGILAWFAR